MPESPRRPVDDLATAVVFLTRIPVPWHIPDLDARLPRATPWFPVVGLLVGLVGAAVWWLADAYLGRVIAAIAAVAATALVTGAFHEDGLADTFDGLGGSPDRERALAIMKDSRVGTYGALVLLLVLLGRIVALAELHVLAPAALMGAHVLARWSSLPLIRALPYARTDGGTGKPFAGGVTETGLLVATTFTALVTLALWGLEAVVVWIAVVLVSLLLAGWFRRRLGGITGDTLGAVNQLTELVALLALVALM
ncbi:MAG: adenosylcobinamide-GDP ribazoletransferase [Halofilum sp. (in: g-proteobacteria)]|nr:adenosylcobinamide-GDP ribazoletransferase [Halofilum sp. (in: g-proteobacteria)]